MLKTRILTGILLIGFVFWALFSLPSQGFVVVVGILSLCMMREWITLMGIKHRLARILILDIFLVGEFLIGWFLPQLIWLFWVAILFWFLLIPALVIVQYRQQYPRMHQGLLLMIGYFSLFMFYAGLLQLRDTLQGSLLVLLAFVIVWCSDSIAYAVGRMIGRHKLIPFVSPGKTWEGFIGASILTLPLLAIYWIFILHKPMPQLIWMLGMYYLVIMALVGDLSESLIKRMMNVKDSGNILPGHGGLLDRFDSLIAVAPVMAALTLQGLL